jgi:hypothetical protein
VGVQEEPHFNTTFTKDISNIPSVEEGIGLEDTSRLEGGKTCDAPEL